MKQEIEQIAQRVYQVVQGGGPTTLGAIREKVKGATGSQVLVAVGWLARDGGLVLRSDGRTIHVALERRPGLKPSERPPLPISADAR